MKRSVSDCSFSSFSKITLVENIKSNTRVTLTRVQYDDFKYSTSSKHQSKGRSDSLVPVLDALRQAVQRRLLALGLQGVVSFPRGLLGGSGQLASERVSGQKVEDRIHAAVEAGQAAGHLVGGVHAVVEGTHIRALEVQSRSHVQVLHDVEGQVGDGEHREHDDDQVYGLLPQRCVVHVVADEGFDDAAVAAEDDDEGDAEAEHRHAHAVDEVSRQLVFGRGVVARR